MEHICGHLNVTTCEFSICYKIIVWFLGKFKYLQIFKFVFLFITLAFYYHFSRGKRNKKLQKKSYNNGVRVTQSLVFCVRVCRSLFILLSIFLLRWYCLSSEHPFGIFKLLLRIKAGTCKIYIFFLLSSIIIIIIFFLMKTLYLLYKTHI